MLKFGSLAYERDRDQKGGTFTMIAHHTDIIDEYMLGEYVRALTKELTARAADEGGERRGKIVIAP